MGEDKEKSVVALDSGWKPETGDATEAPGVTGGQATDSLRSPHPETGLAANGNSGNGMEGNVYAEKPTPPPANKEEAVADQFTPKQQEYGNLQDVIDYLEGRIAEIHLPTKEDLEKERRRRRTEGIISSVADGVRALGNLVFTTQYAPDMYRYEDSMTEKAKARWEKEKKDREAEADRYFNYALTLGKLKEGIADKKYQHGRDALLDNIRVQQETRAQLKALRDAAMSDLRMQLLAGKISEQEAAAKEAQIDAAFAEDYKKAEINKINSQTAKNNRAPARGGGSGGGKGGGGKGAATTWYATDASGNVHSFTAKSEPHAHNVAGANGWNVIGSTTTTTTDNGYGQKKTSTRTKQTDKSVKGKNTKKLGL